LRQDELVCEPASLSTQTRKNDTPVRLDEEDAKFRAAVRRDIEQPDRGELIDHEEVVARMERLLQPR